MKIVCQGFLFLQLLVCSLMAFAETPTQTLTRLLSNIHTMQADFTQVVNEHANKPLQQSTGHMALLRPGKFRWDVKEPVAQLVIANGNRLWIYDPDLEQVTVRFISKEVGQTPALLLSNTNDTLAKDFSVTTAQNDPQMFILKPKTSNSMLKTIRLGFLNNQIQEMDLEDHLGHVTSVKFNHIRMNTALAASLFNFRLPPNVDVIDETKRRA